jgi:hypothetical protein
VARIYTPKDYRVGEIMGDIARLVLDNKPQTGA